MDQGLKERMSGSGYVWPETADGLLDFARRHDVGGGPLGMKRETFIHTVRTLIDNGRIPEPERVKLVANGFPELDD